MISICAAIISGCLLFAAFPSFDISMLAWIALVPLFLVLIQTRPAKGFLLLIIFGVAFYTGLFFWMFDLPKYRILHHAILGIYLCPLLGLFGAGFCFVSRRWSITAALIAAPFFWVTQEYIQSNLFFLSLPWGLLAHSQYQNPKIIQIASVTGVWGISFLIVLVNSALTAVLYSLLIKFKAPGQSLETPFGKHSMAGIVGITAIFFFASLIYGHTLTSRPLTGKKVMVSVVQGNIAQSKKWDPKYASEIMQTYTELTQKASKDRPSLIIWPETATPRAITENLSLLWQIRRIAGEAGIPLLIGSSERQKFKKEGANQKRKYLNSAFLIRSNPKTQKPQRYDKIRLLPFGEYLPLREKVPWHAINIPEISGFARGKEFTVFKLPDLRFGVTICWENIFPDVVREFVKKGAQVIINIGNEAWFGKSAAPYQFLSMNVFRAVENGVFVVRCTNTGVSCFIDSRGRIVDRVTGENNSEIFVRGILSNVVVLQDSTTIYSRYGDFFSQLCLILSAIFILFAALRKPGAVT